MPLALIIDDEPQIRRLLRMTLVSEEYEILEAETGEKGLQRLMKGRPDVIVLDLGLTDMDGLVVLERIREFSQVPVLILSVREDESDKVRALDLGADDFVNKPFAAGELLARLRAIQRRAQAGVSNEPILFLGDLKVDFSAHQVWVAGAEVKLTSTEFALLTILLNHQGKVVTQKQLLREVWGPNAEDQSQYLRVYFTHLRKKIDPEGRGLIETEPRVGYRFRGLS